MRRRFALPLLLLGLLVLPAAADPRPDILYTTRKEFVRVSPPRPLTLNAHIDKFAYDPLGLEVACAGSETQDGQTTYFVKTLDVRTGKELHRLTMTVPQYTDSRLEMMGWTPSGKYLLLEQTQPKEADLGGSTTHLERWDLSADPPKLLPVNEAFPVPQGTSISSISHFASPHGRRVLLVGYYSLEGSTHSAYQVYDAEQDTSRTLTLPQGTELLLRWTNDSHLLVQSGQNQERRRMDAVTGQLSPLNTEADDDPAASKQYPDLSLEMERRRQADTQGGGGFDSRILWVRCAPRLKQPLSSVGAGLTMTDEDPQAVWSPGGKQVAFLTHGDLYITDLMPSPPGEHLIQEKQALGLPLTCPEERELAMNNLKKIGLGLIMYSQDHDEHYPAAAGVEEAIIPYIKDRTVFSVGAIHWAYHAPKDLSLAAMESPAETVMATTTLPCGQVTLMGDGHVKMITGKE